MDEKYYCAIDIGGTKILMLLLSTEGKVLFKEKCATPVPKLPEAIIQAITGLLEKGKQRANLSIVSKPAGTGLCIAGFIDHNKGIVYQSPNLEWQKPVAICKMLEKVIGCPVIIENDANAAVLGEVYFGAAKGHRDVIYVTISTGIGGGLFLDGRLYRGSDGFAGEIGHIKPFGRGRTCKCGGSNCLEAWAAGTGISSSAEELWTKNETENDHITAEEVFQMADQGNNLALEIINNAAEKIGYGLANLVNLFNPTCIVIGGGIAGNRADFMKVVDSKIMDEAIYPSVNITTLSLKPAYLEPEAGIWGMFALLTGKVVDDN